MSGTAYPSGAPEFIPGFLWGSCCSIFIFLCCVLQIIVCYFLHFGHCIICPASIYGFCLPLWYLKFRPFLGLSNWPLINVREEGLHQFRFSILYTLDYGRLNMITFFMAYFIKIIIKEKDQKVCKNVIEMITSKGQGTCIFFGTKGEWGHISFAKKCYSIFGSQYSK